MIKYVGGPTEMKMMFVSDILERKLNAKEKQRISNENIFLSIIEVPACTIYYRNNPFNDLSEFHLVLISNELTISDPMQTVAVILHEIGHIVNNPNSEIVEEKEFYADDYVRNCSFGKKLLDNLKSSILNESDVNKKDLMKKRIDRLENNVPRLLNLK